MRVYSPLSFYYLGRSLPFCVLRGNQTPVESFYLFIDLHINNLLLMNTIGVSRDKCALKLGARLAPGWVFKVIT